MSIVFRYYTEICEFSILCPTTQKKIAQNNKKIVSKSSAHVSIYELHCFFAILSTKKVFFRDFITDHFSKLSSSHESHRTNDNLYCKCNCQLPLVSC